MQTDLWLSKKEQILDFIRRQGYARTSDVIRFGLSIYHIRADRDARELAEEDKIKRMDDWNKRAIFGDIKEDVWECET